MASPEDRSTYQHPASADDSESKILFTDDIDVLDVVDFPCLVDDNTVEFLRSHGRILFLSRGPPGSGKGTVASRLHELYPGSRIYWADKMFLSPLAPPRTKETLKQSHELCLQKTTKYMQQNEPVIINRSTNMRVWETSQYLQIAAMYGYTVIILDIDKNLILKPEVLAVTNSKGLDQNYMTNRMKQWEHIYPYAMGWSPRPRDAAFLLHRYGDLYAELTNHDNGIVLRPVQCAQFFPFCIARVCWFGWDEQDRKYCHSELVKKAYGSKDTITVFGYALLGDLVMAVVKLTEAQAALMGTNGNPVNRETITSRYKNAQEYEKYDEMLCTVDLSSMFAKNESDETDVLEEGERYYELPPPSQVSFIVLGSTAAGAIKYSSAVQHAGLLLNHMHSWDDMGAAPRICMDVNGISVYGTHMDTSDDLCLLIVDKNTVKLDVVFTGHYQAYTTRSSDRCPTWSAGLKRHIPKEHHVLDYVQRTAAMRTGHGEPASSQKDAVQQLLDSVDAPCLKHDGTQQFLRTHGRLFIVVRGPSGSGKEIVADTLEELYANSSNTTTSSEISECHSSTTASAPPDSALNKIESYMKNDVPMLYRYTDIMVWQVTKYLALASKYGYTVIVVDMPHHLASNPRAPYIAMGRSNQAKQWEEVYPFAMGWSPRPRDAAWLLQRFRQIRNILHDEDTTLTPGDITSSHVYPFCLAKLCLFGYSAADKDYCKSEKLRHAYGRSDTLRVFGYAVTRGFVFAMVELSEDQASLTGRLEGVDEGDENIDAVARQLTLSLGFQTWEEVPCTVDMAKFARTNGSTDGENLHLVGNKINLRDVPPSRITFMPLGSIDGTEYRYSKAVAYPWLSLSSMLRSWRAAEDRCTKRIKDIDVYGSLAPPDKACMLVVDHVTIKLDVVFTGYYQPYATSLSGRSRSHAQSAGSTRWPSNWGGRYRLSNQRS